MQDLPLDRRLLAGHSSHITIATLVRTIAGEAGQESELGKAAAHVIMNRVDDPGFGDNPAEVSGINNSQHGTVEPVATMSKPRRR